MHKTRHKYLAMYGKINELSLYIIYVVTENNVCMIYYYSEISYQLILEVNGDNCGGVFNLIEAIEFAVRTNDLWIPLRISCYGICGSGTTSITVRGYNVSVSTTTSPETEEVFICGDLLEHAEDIQFRWMGITGSQEAAARLDIWALSEVTAMLIRDNQPNRVLFEERFGTGVLK